jgi:hypothetical protein
MGFVQCGYANSQEELHSMGAQDLRLAIISGKTCNSQKPYAIPQIKWSTIVVFYGANYSLRPVDNRQLTFCTPSQPPMHDLQLLVCRYAKCM